MQFQGLMTCEALCLDQPVNSVQSFKVSVFGLEVRLTDGLV